MPDNLAPTVDTADPIAPPVKPPITPTFTWKSNLPADYSSAPTMAKFPDTKEGLAEAVKSHLSLEKLLGNEKVPIPKGPEDTAALAIFNKAMGIPEKPEGYALPEIDIPKELKGMTFDKAKFQEVVHKHGLTPGAAKGLWETYTAMSKQVYADAVKSQEEKVTGILNGLMAEWGEAYKANVEQGQNVINKFSDDQEMNDFITSSLVSDPRGIKFLAKIGKQFSENKLPGFESQRFSKTPDEAQSELDKIRRDMGHPYNNEKAPIQERDRAIGYVNDLIALVQRAKR